MFVQGFLREQNNIAFHYTKSQGGVQGPRSVFRGISSKGQALAGGLPKEGEDRCLFLSVSLLPSAQS